jgi:hypothetical protein
MINKKIASLPLIMVFSLVIVNKVKRQELALPGKNHRRIPLESQCKIGKGDGKSPDKLKDFYANRRSDAVAET